LVLQVCILAELVLQIVANFLLIGYCQMIQMISW